MQNPHELVLLYRPNVLEEFPALRAVLTRLGIALRPVSPAQAHETVGFLAGLSGFSQRPAPAVVPAISDPVLILCGFASDRLDLLLGGLREAGAPRFPYKAVLTEHNCGWTLAALYEELRGERAAIARRQAERSE